MLYAVRLGSPLSPTTAHVWHSSSMKRMSSRSCQEGPELSGAMEPTLSEGDQCLVETAVTEQ